MRVIDASAAVDMLLGRVSGDILHGEVIAVPHLIDSEVLHTLRRLEHTAGVTPAIARGAVLAFGRLPLRRYGVDKLLPRIWELRHDLTGYDATYVALAEASGATSLLTSDERLARTTGVRCAIELI